MNKLYEFIDDLSQQILPHPGLFVQVQKLGRLKYKHIACQWYVIRTYAGNEFDYWKKPVELGEPFWLNQEEVDLLTSAPLDSNRVLERARPVIERIREHFGVIANAAQLL